MQGVPEKLHKWNMKLLADTCPLSTVLCDFCHN